MNKCKRSTNNKLQYLVNNFNKYFNHLPQKMMKKKLELLDKIKTNSYLINAIDSLFFEAFLIYLNIFPSFLINGIYY